MIGRIGLPMTHGKSPAFGASRPTTWFADDGRSPGSRIMASQFMPSHSPRETVAHPQVNELVAYRIQLREQPLTGSRNRIVQPERYSVPF
ncbi:hypothetical protein SXCC_00788 [Gluconacetobacter sp. SXCC-1]|nr:hypothetical protein SXCC_00788 [Gluconacetobacter sp. SXCC-1]